jgi:hypothetical protein
MPMTELRTLFATAADGLTLVLRRFDRPGEPAAYWLSAYRAYLSASPMSVALPEDIPVSFSSLEKVVELASHTWGVKADAFQDVRQGREVVIDFTRALHTGGVEPLREGLSARELVELLGVPEAVNGVSHGMVVWFYGCVQMILQDGVFQCFEIDNGGGDFTSLRLEGWFLERSTTQRQLEQELRRRLVPYTQAGSQANPAIRAHGSSSRGSFLFDFYGEGERIHALYWNFEALRGP